MEEEEDADQLPLIGASRPTDQLDHGLSGEAGPDEDSLESPGWFLWALSLSAAISGLLFGYDTGVISATLVGIGSDLSQRPLSTLDKSLITACTSLFALFASPLAGTLADRYGRKGLILVCDALFAAGALWQACTTSVWGMIGGRSVVGLAVGPASLVVPLYIAEIAPAPFRGRLVTLSCLSITLGQVVAYVVGYLLSDRASGWRWMVGLGAAPACVQLLALAFLPESPRWLVKHGRADDARLLLYKIYGGRLESTALSSRVLRAIERGIAEDDEERKKLLGTRDPGASSRSTTSWVDVALWRDLVVVPRNRRALTIACLLQGAQQLCGFNSLMYFSATIFAQAGFKSPVLTSLSIAITNFVFTVVAFRFIDRIGRRKMLLWSISVMVIALIPTAIGFYLNPAARQPGQTIVKQHDTHGPWPKVILGGLMLYVAGYALGLGNVPWQQSELFPLSVRAIGSGVATATNWACNFLVGLTFLPLVGAFTLAGAMVAFIVFCVTADLLVWRFYPETVGMTIEQVSEMLRDGWGTRRKRSHRITVGLQPGRFSAYNESI